MLLSDPVLSWRGVWPIRRRERGPTLAPEDESAHTADMSLKNAAVLALIGMLLLTILLAADFIKTVSGVLNDVVPAMALLRSLAYLLASLSVAVFFYVFHRAQSR